MIGEVVLVRACRLPRPELVASCCSGLVPTPGRQLTKHQSAGAWHFAPGVVNMQVGQTLVAVNNGGEVHTFTEVEHFGGGSVPVLNQLSGNPDPAPECLALTASDSIPPGGTTSDVEDESGTELYQCCIHPWMRAVVHVRGN